MAQSQSPDDGSDVVKRLGDKSKAYGIDESDTGFIELEEDALEEAEEQLEENRRDYERMGNDPEKSVDDVLSADNVREVVFDTCQWQDPKVTIWLRDCPHWANWAGNRKVIRIDGRRDLHYVLDIRPF